MEWDRCNHVSLSSLLQIRQDSSMITFYLYLCKLNHSLLIVSNQSFHFQSNAWQAACGFWWEIRWQFEVCSIWFDQICKAWEPHMILVWFNKRFSEFICYKNAKVNYRLTLDRPTIIETKSSLRKNNER